VIDVLRKKVPFNSALWTDFFSGVHTSFFFRADDVSEFLFPLLRPVISFPRSGHSLRARLFRLCRRKKDMTASSPYFPTCPPPRAGGPTPRACHSTLFKALWKQFLLAPLHFPSPHLSVRTGTGGSIVPPMIHPLGSHCHLLSFRSLSAPVPLIRRSAAFLLYTFRPKRDPREVYRPSFFFLCPHFEQP